MLAGRPLFMVQLLAPIPSSLPLFPLGLGVVIASLDHESWDFLYTLCNHHFITMFPCEASRILFSAVTLTDILLYGRCQIMNPNQQREKNKYEHKVIDPGFLS